jgi:hypothetical protein
MDWTDGTHVGGGAGLGGPDAAGGQHRAGPPPLHQISTENVNRPTTGWCRPAVSPIARAHAPCHAKMAIDPAGLQSKHKASSNN